MEGVEASVEDGSHHNNPDNIYVELNNQPSKLPQTVKYLKIELQTVKQDNERILRAQEELNQILLDKIHNGGKDKRKEYETNSGTASYKRKGKKLKFYDSESKSSSGVKVRSHRGRRYKYTSESSESDHSPRKRKYKPYEEISGEFKKIKPSMFNGEVEEDEEAEAWLSVMKKYFQIYKYSNRLKSWMAIYNQPKKRTSCGGKYKE